MGKNTTSKAVRKKLEVCNRAVNLLDGEVKEANESKKEKGTRNTSIG